MSDESTALEPLWYACPSCGELIDAAGYIPFTKVVCSHCEAAMRVRAQLGKFQILEEIGLGGMSHVFRALDMTLERKVALKVLNDENSQDPERVRAFEREARLTASVRHPNIVQLYSTGWDANTFYLAMELVEGGSLEDKLRNGGEAEASLMAHASQIVLGLRAAHRAGLLHRDIKPGNILFDNHGNAKLVDFGLALMGEEDDDGEMWATPWYVAPEKLRGEQETVRSDIYSLGATLRHVLTGIELFPAHINIPAELLEYKRALEPLVGADEEGLKADEDVARLIDRMMAFEPSQRFANYDELADEMAGVRATLDERTMQLTRRLERQRKRRNQRLLLGVIAAFLVLSVGAWILAYGLFSNDPGQEAPSWGEIAHGGTASSSHQQFLDAATELTDGDFTEAFLEFQRLSEDMSTPPATAAWSAWNAAVAAWLRGEDGAARRVLETWRNSSASGSEEVPSFFVPMIDQVFQPGAVSPNQLGDEGTVAAMGLLAGLEAWSVGRFDLAEVWFSRFDVDEGVPPWSSGYRAHLDGYHEDAAQWAKLAKLEDLEDVEQARQAAAALAEFRAAVRTRGRMPWTLDWRTKRLNARLGALEDRRRRDEQEALRQAQEEREQAWTFLVAVIKAQINKEEPDRKTLAKVIAAARNIFEKSEIDGDDLKRLEAFEQVAEMIFDAPSAIAIGLSGRTWEGTLEMREGEPMEDVALSGDGAEGLRVSSGGKEIPVATAEISESALASLGQEALAGIRDSSRYYQLREGLIWRLLFLHPENTDALGELSAEYPPFRERWALLRDLTSR